MPLSREIAVDLAKLYVESLYGGYRERHLFKDIEAYCMFVGYPRSGHSIVAWLLDAHPEIVIAPELDALKYVHARFRRNQIYSLILRQSRIAARERAGNPAAGLPPRPSRYEVPDQWQGKFRRLTVIGDKKGGGSAMRFGKKFELLDRLKVTIDAPLRFLHVVRNPYDNIRTMAKADKTPLEVAARHYFYMCRSVVTLRERIPKQSWHELHHEDLIDRPRSVLRELCDFVGVRAMEDYIEASASIVYSSPHKSRVEVDWSPELADAIDRQMDRFDFLRRYSYSD